MHITKYENGYVSLKLISFKDFLKILRTDPIREKEIIALASAQPFEANMV